MSGINLGLGELVKSGNQAVRDVITTITKHYQDEQLIKILDEMLRSPRYRFRSTKLMAKEIGDTTPNQEITRHILVKMGAQPNSLPDGKDTWQMAKYWEETAGPPWKLKPDVNPGKR
jgi:hypothetical protein